MGQDEEAIKTSGDQGTPDTKSGTSWIHAALHSEYKQPPIPQINITDDSEWTERISNPTPMSDYEISLHKPYIPGNKQKYETPYVYKPVDSECNENDVLRHICHRIEWIPKTDSDGKLNKYGMKDVKSDTENQSRKSGTNAESESLSNLENDKMKDYSDDVTARAVRGQSEKEADMECPMEVRSEIDSDDDFQDISFEEMAQLEDVYVTFKTICATCDVRNQSKMEKQSAAYDAKFDEFEKRLDAIWGTAKAESEARFGSEKTGFDVERFMKLRKIIMEKTDDRCEQQELDMISKHDSVKNESQQLLHKLEWYLRTLS